MKDAEQVMAERAMNALRMEIADRLCDVEALCRRVKLPMTRFTLVARDPSNDRMFVTVTNEPDAELARAFEVARGLHDPGASHPE